MQPLQKEAVEKELVRLAQEAPASEEERSAACRAIVRYKQELVLHHHSAHSIPCPETRPPAASQPLPSPKHPRLLCPPSPQKDEATVVPTEEWVRLYIALRRVRQKRTGGIGAAPKIACDVLKSWKTRVSQTISVKRKLFILDAEAFNNISPRPEGIDAFLVDPSSVVLPADVLSSETVLIDDGFPREHLKCPGVLHLEVAVNWTQRGGDTGNPLPVSDAPASSTTDTAPQRPTIDLAPPAPGAPASSNPSTRPVIKRERHEAAQDVWRACGRTSATQGSTTDVGDREHFADIDRGHLRSSAGECMGQRGQGRA